MTTFDEFLAGVVEEAHASGPDAVAELDGLGLRFSLARQLAARRRALHLTQRQVAAMTSIERAEIGRIERGQTDPTIAVLGALTRALGVDIQLVVSRSHPVVLPRCVEAVTTGRLPRLEIQDLGERGIARDQGRVRPTHG